MLKKFYTNISRMKEWYTTYRKEIKLISACMVKNKLLYQELEQACNRQGGILTYAEYLTIDQFGKHGYYATSTQHGKTDVDKRWGQTLALYCHNFGHDTLIEFGCGMGELGITTVKAYKQLTKKQLNWIGVEIDTQIHGKIIDNFTAQNMQDSIKKIATTLNELPSKDNALIVFPYSLDNIPPQVFLNTQPGISYPNAMLGIKVAKGALTEVIIPPEILAKKRIKLENGIFTHANDTCKLTSWKLRTGQRAYIPTDSFFTLNHYAKKFNHNPTFIIIDEFRKEPWFFNLENLGTPKSLYEKNLVAYDKPRYYHESGEHNLYYPLYKDSLLKFLSNLGFQSIDYEIEQKKAAQLRNKPWFAVGKYATLAFIAKNLLDKETKILPIPFNPQRIF